MTADVGYVTITGLHYTMHQPTVTTSVSLPWWALVQASMSWTREAAALCTMQLLPTQMESKFYAVYIFIYNTFFSQASKYLLED